MKPRMKAYRPRYLPVFPGFKEGEWLHSPPESPVWGLHYLLSDGSMVAAREEPVAFMDTLSSQIVPAPYFVLTVGNA